MDGMLCDRCGLPATHFHEDYGNVCASCAAHWSERFDTRHEQPPPWACRQWGGYGHDWLDCDECVRAYEAQAWVTPNDPWYEDDGDQADGEDQR